MKTGICSILFVLLASSVFANSEIIRSGDGETTELWEGRALTARFKVGMCFNENGQARGVLLLRHANGQEDTYHLNGTIKDNVFNLSHSSGHYFKGILSGPAKMEGKARLKSGLSLTLAGKRIRGAPLKAPDCAPLTGN